MLGQHVTEKEDCTITGGLCSHFRAAKFKTLSSENPYKTVRYALILAEHKTNLTPPNANVTSRYIGVFSNVSVQLSNK